MAKLRVYRQIYMACADGVPHLHLLTLPENHYWMIPDGFPDKPVPSHIMPVFRVQAKGKQIDLKADAFGKSLRYSKPLDLLEHLAENRGFGKLLGTVDVGEKGEALRWGLIWNDDGSLRGIEDTTKCDDSTIAELEARKGHEDADDEPPVRDNVVYLH